MSQPELIEGIHFYINKDGYIVLTEKYHLEKGFCCLVCGACICTLKLHYESLIMYGSSI